GSIRDWCGVGAIGGPTPNVSFGFGQCDVDTADQVGDQVVQHRTDRGQGREQHDVQGTDHAGVTQDPAGREPCGRVEAELVLATVALQKSVDHTGEFVEDTQYGQDRVDHCDRDEQDDEAHEGDDEAELHHRPRLHSRDRQVC